MSRSRFSFTPTALKGLMVVERQRLADHRGYLSRVFCAEELSAVGFALPIAQINHALTRQPPAQSGLVIPLGL